RTRRPRRFCPPAAAAATSEGAAAGARPGADAGAGPAPAGGQPDAAYIAGAAAGDQPDAARVASAAAADGQQSGTAGPERAACRAGLATPGAPRLGRGPPRARGLRSAPRRSTP